MTVLIILKNTNYSEISQIILKFIYLFSFGCTASSWLHRLSLVAVWGCSLLWLLLFWGFPGGTVVENQAANTGHIGDLGSIPGSGRSPGGGHGNPLQYSCLENSMDRGAWRATVHRVTESDTTQHAHRLLLWSAGSKPSGFRSCGARAYLPRGMWNFLVQGSNLCPLH